MLIDTHCHLNFEAFDQDLDAVLQRAKEYNVDKIIIPGAKLDSSEKAVEISSKYDNCYAAVGIHPHHFSEYYDTAPYHSEKNKGLILVNKLNNLTNHNKVVAIGEIGLDYFQYEKTVYEKPEITPEIKKRQKELFQLQLNIAIKLQLPVILHCREAYKDILEIVEEHELKGVFHCFGGTIKDLKKVLSLGFYVGFDGNITFKNADNLRLLVKNTPLERILVETDSPYLTPVPNRGQRNEPKNVKIVAEEIAKVKGINKDIVEKVAANNANTLFFHKC